jgi:hypothetical protein
MIDGLDTPLAGVRVVVTSATYSKNSSRQVSSITTPYRQGGHDSM